MLSLENLEQKVAEFGKTFCIVLSEIKVREKLIK